MLPLDPKGLPFHQQRHPTIGLSLKCDRSLVDSGEIAVREKLGVTERLQLKAEIDDGPQELVPSLRNGDDPLLRGVIADILAPNRALGNERVGRARRVLVGWEAPDPAAG